MDSRYLHVLFIIVVLSLLIQPIHSISVGKPAPDFTLKSLSDNLVSLSELRGKVVILDFWATWCGPCKMQMQILARIYGSYVGKDVVILSINMMEDFKTVKDFVNSNDISWTILMDTDGRVAGAYDIHAIPTIVVIDRDGVARFLHTGVVGENTLRNWINTILEGEATGSSNSSTSTGSVGGQCLILDQTMITVIAIIVIVFAILVVVLMYRRKAKLLNI